MLSEEDARQRMIWARKYQYFTYLQWRRVRWSDECSIELGKGQKPSYVFSSAGKERLRPELVQEKPCGKQKCQMFWAAFGYGIRTPLVPMEGDSDSRRGGVTAKVYKDILDEYLPPILGIGAIFMQDNAPIHTARIIRDWLIENGVKVMVWPKRSPDLNPIENLWALLKAQIYKTYPELLKLRNTEATLRQLIRCAIATWEDFGEQIMARLIDTMVNRVKAVILADGWYTTY